MHSCGSFQAYAVSDQVLFLLPKLNCSHSSSIILTPITKQNKLNTDIKLDFSTGWVFVQCDKSKNTQLSILIKYILLLYLAYRDGNQSGAEKDKIVCAGESLWRPYASHGAMRKDEMIHIQPVTENVERSKLRLPISIWSPRQHRTVFCYNFQVNMIVMYIYL